MAKLWSVCFKIISFGALSGALLFTLTGCQSVFYHPTDIKYYDPARLNLAYEDVFIKTASGSEINAWYFATPQKESKGTVLFFHGNAQNLSSHFMMFYWLPQEGYNYMIFDYPGYGRSPGEPNPGNTVEAGVAAAAWLKENKDQRPLIIYGQSLGGVIAMQTVMKIKDHQPIRNVIIDGSFSSYRKMGRRVLSRSWLTWWLQPLTYVVLSDSESPEPIDRISPIPMLFIHGTNDPIIEPASSEEMFAAAREPKQFWLIPGGQHGDLFEVNNREIRQKLLNYLQ